MRRLKFLVFVILLILTKSSSKASPVVDSENDSDPISISFSIDDLGGFGSREWRDREWYPRHDYSWKDYDGPPESYWRPYEYGDRY